MSRVDKKCILGLFAVILLVAGVFVCKAAKTTALVDHSYMIENSYRIYLGQTPYRDFVLSLPVGSFYITALFWHLFGLSQISVIIGLAVTYVIGLFIVWDTLSELTGDRLWSAVMLFPLAFAGYGLIGMMPSYDINETFACALSLDLFLKLLRTKKHRYAVLTGLSMLPVLLFKHTTGAVFLGLMFLLVTAALVCRKLPRKDYLCYCAGTAASVGAVVGWLLMNGVLKSAWVQMFQYPSSVRSAAGPVKDVIKSFVSKDILIILATTLLICVCGHILLKKRENAGGVHIVCIVWSMAVMPLIRLLISSCDAQTAFGYQWNVLLIMTVLLLAKKAITERRLDLRYAVYAVVLLFIGANFTSQGINGSTYGLYPFFMILLAILYREKALQKATLIAAVICTAFGLIMINVTESRLDYVTHDSDLRAVTVQERLYPLAADESFIREFDGLAAWLEDNVRKDETVYALPGEDPLYFATGREPQLGYFQLNETTFPYEPVKVAEDCKNARIDYLIVKEHLQCPNGFMDFGEIIESLKDSYELYTSIEGYRIYKLRAG